MNQQAENQSPRRKWPTWLKLCWTIVGVPVCLVWGAAYAAALKPPYGRWHDFLQEWTSVRNYFSGQPLYLDMRESVPMYFGVPYNDMLHVNAHPPVANLLVLPFARLPYDEAFLAWAVFSLIALVVAVGLILYQADLKFSPWVALPIAVVLLTSNPLAQQVFQGQWNLVLLLLITLAWLGIRSDRPVLGGAALGIAAAVKLFPAFLFLYLVAQRRWRCLGAALGVFAGLNVATALIFGMEAYTSYLLQVMPQVGQFQDHWLNASLAGFFHKLFDAASGHAVPLWQNAWLVRICVLVTCLGVVAATAWLARGAETKSQRDASFAVTVVAMLLVSPIAWDHYFLLLILPLAILWRQPTANWTSRTFLSLVIVVLATIRPRWIWDATIAGDGELAVAAGTVASIASPWQTLTVISFQFYALLALFLVAWWRTAREIKPVARASAERSANSPARLPAEASSLARPAQP